MAKIFLYVSLEDAWSLNKQNQFHALFIWPTKKMHLFFLEIWKKENECLLFSYAARAKVIDRLKMGMEIFTESDIDFPEGWRVHFVLAVLAVRLI